MAPTHATFFRAYAALLLLLALTAAAAYLPPGPWSVPIALAIATAKLAIVFLFFMQLRYQRGLIRLAALAGFFWLALAAVLTLADYLTRDWMIGSPSA